MKTKLIIEILSEMLYSFLSLLKEKKDKSEENDTDENRTNATTKQQDK